MNYRSTEMIAIVRNTILARTCPLTSGLPTAMTLNTYKKMCRIKQDAARVSWFDGKQILLKKPHGKCGECMGKNVPAELEIITMEGIMGTVNRNNAKCELCGEKKACFTNHGSVVCGSCSKDQATAKNFPERAVALIEKFHGREKALELFGVKPGGIEKAADCDSCSAAGAVERLEDFTNLVGRVIGIDSEKWQGRDNLILAVNQTAAALENAERCNDIYSRDLQGLSAQFVAIRRSMGVEDPTVDIVEVISELAQSFDRYKRQCESLTERLREADKMAAWHDAIVEQIREALDQPLLPVGEIAMHCKSLRASVGFFPPAVERIAAKDWNSPSLDSHLLDLALGVLDGRVTGVAPEFISTLREAA